MTTQVNVAEAKAKLSDLVERAAAGEEVIIARHGTPRVRLVPVVQARERRPGRWQGMVIFGPGWDDDLTDEFEDLRDDAVLPPT